MIEALTLRYGSLASPDLTSWNIVCLSAMPHAGSLNAEHARIQGPGPYPVQVLSARLHVAFVTLCIQYLVQSYSAVKHNGL